jgi:hypothetical protein
MEVSDMLTLSEFGDMLRMLAVGQSAALPYYAHLFPPGEPDEGARGRAYEFARAHGCEIDNQKAAKQANFIKRITNPTPRVPV